MLILNLLKYENNMKKYEFKNSKKLFERAINTIPMAAQTFSKSYLQWPLNISPSFLKNGKGCLVTDVDNNKYIDYLLALLPIITGYADPDIDKAVKKQIDKGVILSLSHPLEIELSEMLVDIIPYAEMVKLGKNGSDVLSAAVRIARAFTKKDLIAVCGYHGWHDWFIGTTSRDIGIPINVKKLTKTFQFNNIDSFNNVMLENENKFAAIIVEPETTVETNQAFLKYLRKFSRKNNILLIFDEVICGFRSTLGGASKKFNIMPDLGCFGKSMANGYPISALVGKKKYMKLMDDVFVSGTFSGDIVSIAASIATIKKLKKLNVIQKLEQLGEKLKMDLNNIISDNKLEQDIIFEGNNWWPRITIKKNRLNLELLQTLLRQELISNGLFLGASLNLCLSHCEKSIFNKTLKKFEKSMNSIKKISYSKNPERFLRGKKINSVFKVR